MYACDQVLHSYLYTYIYLYIFLVVVVVVVVVAPLLVDFVKFVELHTYSYKSK